MKKNVVLLCILFLIQPITTASAAVDYQQDATTSFFGEYIEPSEDIPEPPQGTVAVNPNNSANAILPQTGSAEQNERVYQVVGLSLMSVLIYTYRKNRKKEEEVSKHEKISYQ